jgi:hypothetical protein
MTAPRNAILLLANLIHQHGVYSKEYYDFLNQYEDDELFQKRAHTLTVLFMNRDAVLKALEERK